MIKYLSEKTAWYLAKDDEVEDIEVVAYGYYMFYQQWLVMLGILVIAWWLGFILPVMASLMVSMPIRSRACGAHANHPLVCKVVSFMVAFIPVLLASTFHLRLTYIFIAVVYLLSIALLARYAPSDTDVKKISNPTTRKHMKLESIVLVTIFFVIAIIIQYIFPLVAFVIVATALITCGFVHPWAYSLLGFDPVTKEARKPYKM